MAFGHKRWMDGSQDARPGGLMVTRHVGGIYLGPCLSSPAGASKFSPVICSSPYLGLWVIRLRHKEPVTRSFSQTGRIMVSAGWGSERPLTPERQVLASELPGGKDRDFCACAGLREVVSGWGKAPLPDTPGNGREGSLENWREGPSDHQYYRPVGRLGPGARLRPPSRPNVALPMSSQCSNKLRFRNSRK